MNQKKEDGAEMLPLVDENGIVTGNASRGVCHDGCKLLHPVVHLHVFNPEGELYLQKRPLWKIVQPGKWDTAVGGHVSFGEHVEKALHREALEELGIKDFQPELLQTYIHETDLEREYVYAYRCTYEAPLMPSSETDGGAYWTVADIASGLGKGIFTPNFEEEFRRFFLASM